MRNAKKQNQNHRSKHNFLKRYILCILLICAGILVHRIVFILRGHVEITSDEAIVGLMARHIQQGDIPLFYWGQTYQGTLQSIIASLFMRLPFPELWMLRISLLSTYILFVVLWILLIKRLYGWKVSLVTGFLLAFSPHFVTYWGVYANGGYNEVLWLGTLILLISLKLAYDKPEVRWLILLAFISGVGWWTKQMILPYLLTSILILIFSKSSRHFFLYVKKEFTPIQNRFFFSVTIFYAFFIFLIISLLAIRPDIHMAEEIKGSVFALGLFYVFCMIFLRPVRAYINRQSLYLLFFMFGCFPVVYINWIAGRQLYSGTLSRFPQETFMILKNIITTGLPVLFAMYQDWRQTYSNLPIMIRALPALIFLVSLLYIVMDCIKRALARNKQQQAGNLFSAHLILLFLFFSQIIIVTFIKEGEFMYQPRYIWGLYPVVCAFLGYALFKIHPYVRYSLLPVVFILFALNTFNSSRTQINPRTLFTRCDEELVEKLEEKDIRLVYCGYADREGGYWVAYKLTFIARENIHFLPHKDFYPYRAYYDHLTKFTSDNSFFLLGLDGRILELLKKNLNELKMIAFVSPHRVFKTSDVQTLLSFPILNEENLHEYLYKQLLIAQVRGEISTLDREDILSKLDSLEPSVDIYMNAAKIYIGEGEFAKAISILQDGFKSYPSDSSLKYWLNQILLSYTTSEIPFDDLLSTDVESAEYWLIVAEHCNRASRFSEAKRLMESVIDDVSDSAWAHFQYGMSLYNLAHYEEAEDSFSKAVEISPDYPAYSLFLSKSLFAQGKKEESLKIINGILEKHPGDPDLVNLRDTILRGY